MAILGIDVGTTNSKAGLFEEGGRVIAIASRPTLTYYSDQGYAYYDPEQMWGTIAEAIREVSAKGQNESIHSIGIASMAESGLLVDRDTGEPKSPFLPWFDACSAPQAEQVNQAASALDMFRRSGLRNSAKLGLAKLLWLKQHFPQSLHNTVWLSASSYIAYRLTGKMAFDYTLAARTFAFDIELKEWDKAWLRSFNLDPAIMPEAVPSGTIIGQTDAGLSESLGLKVGTAVGIAGHDHVAAALAVGSITPGVVYDSMGTAETLVGTLKQKPLGQKEFDSGLSYGCHVASGRHFWMGGNSSSGGSVEWMRTMLADESLSYSKMLTLLDEVKEGPTGILYFPYLTGSGAPNPDSKARAAFIGLLKSHGKGDLIKALLEGTAYQLESIRIVAEGVAEREINRILVVGGGTRNPHWLQVKADITNCTLEMPPIEEATLLGAALSAAIGNGQYASAEEAAASITKSEARIVVPRAEQNVLYRKLYNHGYVMLQQPLRQYYQMSTQ